jgi:hypothetical protein
MRVLVQRELGFRGGIAYRLLLLAHTVQNFNLKPPGSTRAPLLTSCSPAAAGAAVLCDWDIMRQCSEGRNGRILMPELQQEFWPAQLLHMSVLCALLDLIPVQESIS